jgi:AraC-like DNA-binding protein
LPVIWCRAGIRFAFGRDRPARAASARARDHIDRNYREPLDLDGLARVAGVSSGWGFKASYGETPIRYLTRRRIERAQDDFT